MPANKDTQLVAHDAATVICLRRCRDNGNWQVLLGQGEVNNWLRSTPEETCIMRYPGEWKFPGGVREEHDVSNATAALRELNEEFLGIKASHKLSILYQVSVKQTRPVRGKVYRMYNYVAFEDDNTWIHGDIVETINKNLSDRRNKFQTLLKSNQFFNLSMQEKSRISPEVHRVNWFYLADAIEMLTSSDLTEYVPVDDWQKGEFQLYGIDRRDSMYQSRVILQEIQLLATKQAIVQHSQTTFQNNEC